MTAAREHTAGARHEREDVAWRDEVLGSLGRIDRGRDGAGPVRRRDAGGDAVLRLDRDGKGGLQARRVVLLHQRQAQLLTAFAGEREADEASPVSRHEIDRLGCRHLRGDDEIAFVLAILVVDENEHAAIARLLDDLLDRRRDFDEAHVSGLPKMRAM